MLDPSLLTALSCTTLLVILLDYLVPLLCATLYSPAHWTGAKEKQFEDVCQALATSYCVVWQQSVAFKDLKESNSKLVSSIDSVDFIIPLLLKLCCEKKNKTTVSKYKLLSKESELEIEDKSCSSTDCKGLLPTSCRSKTALIVYSYGKSNISLIP